MTAVITGIISEEMLEKNQLRLEQERLDRERQRTELENFCKKTFEKHEEKHGNHKGGGAFRDLVKTHVLPRVAREFKELGISVEECELHEVITHMGGHIGPDIIEKDEFVHGVLKISHGVRATSIQELHHEISIIKHTVNDVKEGNDHLIQALGSLLQGRCGEHETAPLHEQE